MIGRRAIVGLSLLCALAFCAFGASSASAATKGVTAFTCAPNVDTKGDFNDEHCDETVTAGTGKFTHVSLPSNPTTVTVTNEKTQNKTSEPGHATLKGVLGGVKSEITCTEVHGHGSLENKLSGEQHSVVFSGKVIYKNCTMPLPTNAGKDRCKVKEPIEFEVTGNSTENGAEMGVLFNPKTPPNFVGLTFEEGPGTKCPVAGKTVNATGNAEATSSQGATAEHGATLEFTKAMTKGVECEKGAGKEKGVCLGGQSAEFSSTVTIKMLSVTGGTPENAISLTTPTGTPLAYKGD
jgi:hypothetical protein